MAAAYQRLETHRYLTQSTHGLLPQQETGIEDIFSDFKGDGDMEERTLQRE